MPDIDRPASLLRRMASSATIEAELLGTLLAYPAEFAEVRDRLAVGDFHHAAHAEVFAAMERIADRGRPVDLCTVANELRMTAAGTIPDPEVFASELRGVAGTPGVLGLRVDQVLSLSLERGIAHAAAETMADVEAPDAPPEDRLDATIARFERLTDRVGGAETTSAADLADRVMAEIDSRSRGERQAGLATGFPRLDMALCGGIPVGQLTVLGARPSIGKTSFALNVVRTVCEAGGAVFLASLEQREEEIGERFFAMLSRVNGRVIRSGKLAADDAGRITSGVRAFRSWRLETCDRGGVKVGQIAAASRSARRKMKGLDLIVVDYLQLIAGDNPRANRNEQVGTAAKRLRELGRDLDVPVLLLCQLNRLATDKDVPALHHLRESGEIEQVADVVMFLHRTGEPGAVNDRIDLHIAKQRNGPLASMEFEHEARYFRFTENGIPR
jgi:replicative DNA helicase